MKPFLFLLFLAGAVFLVGQTPSEPSVLIIDVDNGLFYSRDTPDWTKYATERGPVREVAGVRNFQAWEGIGDIVAVNGKPMRGTWHARAVQFRLAPAPAGGQGIADVTRGGTLEWIMEIIDLEGNRLGSIMGYGWNGGSGPMGADQSRYGLLEMTVTGGTGAFVGVRGQIAFSPERAAGVPAYRGNASMSEDPAFRRENGPGQTRRHIVQIYPMKAPTIDRVLHADFSPVTEESPGRAGETLVLWCANLGPVRPNVEFGKPFPNEPFAVVNAPVEVLVNGIETEVSTKVGIPGETNQFRVDFKLPSALTPSQVTVQIRAAFIDGAAIRFPVR